MTTSEQAYRVEYQPSGKLQLNSELGLRLPKAEERVRQSCGRAAMKPDGVFTTIRAFTGDNPRLYGNSPESWLDLPCLARVLDDDHTVYCSGRAIVGFYFQMDRPEFSRTARPAYLVLDDCTSSKGLRIVWSA